MLDPRERFDAAAGDYERYRPSYPAALVDWMLATARLGPPAAICDVGCGTGISTRLLADRGFDVVGIDPSEPMLGLARCVPGGRYARGEAAATGLPDASVDLVTVAQAFHWFDVPAALAEFRGILRPGGWCAAFWNVRAGGPFLGDYEKLLHTWSSEYGEVQKAGPTTHTIKARPEVVDVREAEFANVQLLDREGLLGRAHSSSYVIHGVADRGGFDRALGELFERHQVVGRVEFRYRTLALCWRMRRSEERSEEREEREEPKSLTEPTGRRISKKNPSWA